MGEIAEMMLDGTLCEGCGEYLDGGGLGFPMRCAACGGDDEGESLVPSLRAPQQPASAKTKKQRRKERNLRARQQAHLMKQLLEQAQPILRRAEGEDPEAALLRINITERLRSINEGGQADG